MDKEEAMIMAAVYDEAMTNALLNGVGLIKIIYNGRGMQFSAISPNEYLDLAESLTWIDKHRVKTKIQ